MLDAGFTILRRQLQRSSVGSRQVMVGRPAKRLFDIVAASLIIICIVPLIVFVSLAMKLLDPGPVIYPHTRIGHRGRRFKCLKFRSMVVGADEVLKALLASDPEIRDIWERTQKLPNDPRITPWGRFLRHSSLDELPQLINVLRGDIESGRAASDRTVRNGALWRQARPLSIGETWLDRALADQWPQRLATTGGSSSMLNMCAIGGSRRISSSCCARSAQLSPEKASTDPLGPGRAARHTSRGGFPMHRAEDDCRFGYLP